MSAIKRKRTSPVWNHFTQNDDKSYARCNHCAKQIKTPHSCTTGLARHLAAHGILLNDGTTQNSFSVNPKELISKLVAKDGLPFMVLTTSDSINMMFKEATNTCMPRSPNTIREIMLQTYIDKKAIIVDKINQLKKNNAKFSVSLDEWTSGGNRRYMNVNLHTIGDSWNLGLARVQGSFSADACKTLLEAKITEFNVKMEDVFGIATDGASTMKKFGRLTGKNHVLCMAHGIHLAVADVLYKQSANHRFDDEEMQVDSEREAQGTDMNFDDEEDPNENGVSDDDSSGQEDEGGIGSMEPPLSDVQEESELHPTLKDLIFKVRKTVKLFRKSALKTEVLLQYSQGTVLILDSTTRWNTLLAMLERILLLKDAVKKAMIDINEPILLMDYDFIIIEQLVETLKPVRVAVDALCRRDANLVTADVALNFMMEKLHVVQSDVGKNLYSELKRRILERRTVLSDAAAYLHYGKENYLAGYSLGYFKKMPCSSLVTTIKNMWEPEVPVCDAEPECVNESLSESLLLEVSLETELSLKINQAMAYQHHVGGSRQSRGQNTALASVIRREMHALEISGNRGKTLQSVYEMLMTVPPSTVEAERAFSSANNFCRKVRTRLSDNSLNALVFLKEFYKKY